MFRSPAPGLLCLLLLLIPCAAAGQCLEGWRIGPESDLPGVNGVVLAMTIHDDGRGPAVYFGGDFTAIGGTPARNVARWDGLSWEPLDAGADREVRALASYGGELYIAGEFTHVGGIEARGVARFGPAGWRPLRTGIDGDVRDMIVHDGRLIMAGDFNREFGIQPGENITSWDGDNWVVVAQGTPILNCLTVWDGRLAAGASGTFPGPAFPNVAILDGPVWSPLPGLNRSVTDLAAYRGELYAAGEFRSSGDNPFETLARWDVAAGRWTAVGPATTAAGEARALAVLDDRLFIGGSFSRLGSVAIDKLAIWDGSMLAAAGPLSSSPSNSIDVLLTAEDRLLIAGDFVWLGWTVGFNLAQWTQGHYQPVTRSLNGIVRRLYRDGDDILAAGDSYLEGRRGVMRLDGDGWSALAGHFSGPTYDLIRHEGSLYACGAFSTISDVIVNNIARLGPGGWERLGLGLGQSPNTVWALADFRGELIAGGTFTATGPLPLSRIARWDGTQWLPLGAGLEHAVRRLAVHEDRLIAAGSITPTGGPTTTRIHAWDGSLWVQLGPDLPGGITQIRSIDGRLYALLSAIVPGQSTSIVRWDGSAWRPLGAGLTAAAADLIMHQGRLTTWADEICRLDGAEWMRVPGSGFPSSLIRILGSASGLPAVTSLVSNGRELLIAGRFTQADTNPDPFGVDRPAIVFARWGCAACAADVDDDGFTDFSDYLLYLNLLERGDPQADLDGDADVDQDDFLIFLALYSIGCP